MTIMIYYDDEDTDVDTAAADDDDIDDDDDGNADMIMLDETELLVRRFSFYKNKLYKNTEAQIWPKIKNKLRTSPA